jgi:hypothetical protein
MKHTDTRVTITFEPLRWRGSSVLTWVLAAEAWAWVLLLLVILWAQP